MKKRNYLINFALKSKYNFFACIVALLVLVFSVSTVTYAWIEGASNITIKATDTQTTAGPAGIVNLSSDAVAHNASINLNSYIDPSNLYLAPATGEINSTTKAIDVSFINTDGTKRAANVNDISNNYIFFEVKIHCNDDMTGLKFSNSSYIKLNNSTVNSVKTGVSVLSASDRSVISSNILTSEQVATGQNICKDIEMDNDYIVQVKIWYDGTDNSGSTVSLNLNIVPATDYVTLFLQDYSNNETTQCLLSGKTLKVLYGSSSKTVTGSKSGSIYTFEKVPASNLSEIKFVAYNTDGSVYKTWDLTGTAVAENSYYNIYGDLKGTYNSVYPVYLKDASAENLLKASPAVTLTNGTESYTMYRGTSTTTYLTYIPKAAATDSKTVTFANSSYYATGAYTDANKYFYLFGETRTVSNSKNLCVGKWYATADQALASIKLQDRTKGRTVQTNAPTMYVSNIGISTPYKAYFNSSSNAWMVTATSEYGSTDAYIWSMYAYDSADALKYYWHKEARDADSDTTYTFTAVVADTAQTSDGTWGKVDASDIDPAILTGEKVSFYGGILSTWTVDGIYISKTSTTAATGLINSLNTPLPSGSQYPTYTLNSRTYTSDKFVNVEPYNYYLKNTTTFEGKKLSDTDSTYTAKGGAFYGLYSTTLNVNYLEVKDPISASTTVNSKNSASTSKISLTPGTKTVSLSTTVGQLKSYLGDNLSIEYHIKYNDNTYYEYISKIENITATTNSTESFDVSDYTQNEGDYFEIATVLTDGDVYYVADRDYVKVTSVVPTERVIYFKKPSSWPTTVYAYSWENEIGNGNQNAAYPGEAMTLVEGTTDFYSITLTNDSWDMIIFNCNNNSYKTGDLTIPTDGKDCYIQSTDTWTTYPPVDTEPDTVTVYLKNAANWSQPRAHIWKSTNTSDNYKTWNTADENMTYDSAKGLWYYTISKGDYDGGYNMICFHHGDNTASSNLSLLDGYIYNNSTGTWYDSTASTKRIYIDPNDCTWFYNDSCYLVIKYTGQSSYISLSAKTTTYNSRKCYYYDIPSDASGIYIARQNSSGTYNNYQIANPLGTQNYYKTNSSFDGGTWSTITIS